MKRNVMNNLTVIVGILIFTGGILLQVFNSNLWYSKKMVSSIREEDLAAVQKIILKKPTCINTYPTITPRKVRAFLDVPRVCYPLTEATYTGNIELVELLIENGADVNCNDGLTPLSNTYRAKKENWYEISQILIKSGASLDYTTDYSMGKSAVLSDIVNPRPGAALPGYIPDSQEEVVASFQYALEVCDHSNVDWGVVFKESVWYERYEIVRILLDQGYCNVNDVLINRTALMYAAMYSTPEMVQLLLDYGADKNLKSGDEGKTACDYAMERYKERGKNEIIALLEN